MGDNNTSPTRVTATSVPGGGWQDQEWEAYLVGGMEAQVAWNKARAVRVPSLGGRSPTPASPSFQKIPRG